MVTSNERYFCRNKKWKLLLLALVVKVSNVGTSSESNYSMHQ